MNETVTTESLMRFLRATPEQRDAIDRFLLGFPGALGGGTGPAELAMGGGLAETLLRIERKVEAVHAAVAGGAAAEVRVSEGEAERVFLLMKRLEGAPKQRKAPLATVFRLLVLGGLSQRAAAARCGCAESLVSARVAAIEQAFGMSVERLRNFASELLSLESAARGERSRKKKHGRPDDFDQPEVAEDEDDGGEDGDEGRYGC